MLPSALLSSAGMLLLIPAARVLAESQARPLNPAPQPNIFAGDWPTAVLTLAIFLLLLFVLKRWAWGPILAGLKNREEHIRDVIEDAEFAHQQARQTLRKYHQQLDQAKDEAQDIIEKGRSEAIQLAKDLKEKAQLEAVNLRRQAQRDIAAAKNQALDEIYAQTADLATEIAGKIISRSLTPEDHQALLQEALVKLQKNNYHS